MLFSVGDTTLKVTGATFALFLQVSNKPVKTSKIKKWHFSKVSGYAIMKSMKDLKILFTEALNLTEDWEVVDSRLDIKNTRLDIYLNYQKGRKFTCPKCGKKCSIYDSKEKVWRHLNFFQYETYIHAKIPRVNCKYDGVTQIDIPWARKNSGFTLLFETFILELAKSMPVIGISNIVNEHDTRLWRVIKHYVENGIKKLDLSNVRRIGVDETSRKRGHKYVTLFVDMDTSKVIFATKGKDAQTIKAFSEFLVAHKGKISQIKEFSSDLSPAFISGIEKYFPKANITFDKFHVVKLLNSAVDQVRREEQKEEKGLKNSRYVWLKNPKNLTEKQRQKLNSYSNKKLKTGRAYRIKLIFQDFYREKSISNIEELKKWCSWAMHSRLEPLKSFVKTIRRHWEGVIQWFRSGLTNAVLEGLNSIVQLSKARARGFRCFENFQTMIYLTLSSIDILPT